MAINIEKNYTVRDKYKGKKWHRRTWDKRKRKPSKINEVVIHGTAGGRTIDGLLRWMLRGERAKSYWKSWALFHYGIGKKGDIVEVIDPLYYVFHSQSGRHDVCTIGIELLNSSKTNRDPYTKEQYASLALLMQMLCDQFPSIRRIVSHEYNAKKYSKRHKDCPGDGFDWEYFSEILLSAGFTFDRNNDIIYDIRLKKNLDIDLKKEMQKLLEKVSK